MIEVAVTSPPDEETAEVEKSLVENVLNGHMWLTYLDGEPIFRMTDAGKAYVEAMIGEPK